MTFFRCIKFLKRYIFLTQIWLGKRLKIRVVCREFLALNSYYWILHSKSESNLFFFKSEMFKTNDKKQFMSTKSPFWICVLVLWIHKNYVLVKKLLWNVRNKVFWYTNIFYLRVSVPWLWNHIVNSQPFKSLFNKTKLFANHLDGI